MKRPPIRTIEVPEQSSENAFVRTKEYVLRLNKDYVGEQLVDPPIQQTCEKIPSNSSGTLSVGGKVKQLGNVVTQLVTKMCLLKLFMLPL